MPESGFRLLLWGGTKKTQVEDLVKSRIILANAKAVVKAKKEVGDG
jgi:hypothetical protein